VGELGTRLREARESRGISFEQAEKETRIRRAFLQALEEERYDALPEDVYARGFIRNYARYLGLDAEELLTLYKKAVGASVASIPQVLNEPLSPRDGPSIGSGILIGAMVVIIIALAGWYIYHRFYLGVEPWPLTLLKAPPATVAPPTATQSAPPTQAPTPAATKALVVEQPTIAPSATPTHPATATSVPATARPTTALSATAAPSVAAARTLTATVAQPTATISQPTSTPTTSIATATPTANVSPTPAPTFEGGVQVRARVTAKTYLEVTVDGERVFTGILDMGAERNWNGRSSVRLRVGNAAGLELVVNGVSVEPLGQEGEVVEVTYTPTSPSQP